MPFELQAAGEGLNLILAGRLGVRDARPLWDALQPGIAAGQIIRLQAGELEELDTSIIQILFRLSSRKGQFGIGKTADSWLTALKARGMEAFFPQASAEPEAPQPQAETKAKSTRQGHGQKSASRR
jgi:ABC-type transporter Mla MlaB component